MYFLFLMASFEASVATRSNMSLMMELTMDMARVEILVSGWICFNILYVYDE